jgi:WD40 repeat protein
MKLTSHKDHFLPTGVLGLAIAPDGSQAVAACVDGSVHAVNLGNGQSAAMSGVHSSYASGCVLLPDGKTVISGGYDGQLLWHDLESRQTWRRVQAHDFWSWQLALSPDGGKVASVTGQYLPGGWKYEPDVEREPSVRVYDTRSGALLANFSHAPPVLSCAFSPDGKHLAAANMMGELRVWELASAETKPAAQWTTPDFTSWGSIKTHHYCGGIYGLTFSPDGASLLCCGMGPMTDPMAGNGKMTWQRRDWRTGELRSQIKDGQHGSGLMETIAWHPAGGHFVMAGRQAQGTWNAAVFSASDGELVHSVDTKKRITQARWSADGKTLIIAGSTGQPQRKLGIWPPWGRVQAWHVEL